MVVTREPEWDDAERESLLALGIYESDICEGCGLHRSISDDPNNWFTFDTRICDACKHAARYNRIVEGQDERIRKTFGDRPRPDTPDPADGRHIYLRQMTPGEVANHQTPREEPSLGGPRRVGPAHS